MRLELDGVETFYGQSQALFGISLTVGASEVVSLMGRNGVGKTTTIRSIMGLTPPRRGRIMFDDTALHGLRPHRIARLGIGLVPEGRQIFPNLTVRENLVATARAGGAREGAWTFGRVLEMFPGLAERQENMGNQLSGGEQQMLAIGRALLTNPHLLILDEATEGLAPRIRREIWRCVERLKLMGQSILLVDKNVAALTEHADRHYIIEKGRVVWQGTSPELKDNEAVQHRYLGV